MSLNIIYLGSIISDIKQKDMEYLLITVQMSEKRIHQIDSKNEWLLFSVTFTAKLELVFVLTFENAFS